MGEIQVHVPNVKNTRYPLVGPKFSCNLHISINILQKLTEIEEICNKS